jgi:hypothetical protein
MQPGNGYEPSLCENRKTVLEMGKSGVSSDFLLWGIQSSKKEKTVLEINLSMVI